MISITCKILTNIGVFFKLATKELKFQIARKFLKPFNTMNLFSLKNFQKFIKKVISGKKAHIHTPRNLVYLRSHSCGSVSK